MQSVDPKTLTRYILENQPPEATGDLTLVLNSIQLACKIISHSASKAGIFNLYGLAGNANSSGDEVKKLDVFSNDVFINCLKFTNRVSVMGSEENESEIFVKDSPNGKYCVVFDPLDGSSNIDANVSVGTIFGIYRVKSVGNPTAEDLLQPGTELVCSGYSMYGGACMLVISFGKDVQGFTLDPTIGEFVLTHPNIRIPAKGKIYSVNEGNSAKWDRAVAEYVHEAKYGVKAMKARYIGSMVGDVHRTLLYGGVFMYPSDKKNKRGKLRLVYELNPMAFLVEAAGGIAITGTERILTIKPDGLHTRRPIILGSRTNVLELGRLYKMYGREPAPTPSKL